MNNIILYLGFLALTSILSVHSQAQQRDVAFDKKNFKGRETEFKEVFDLLKVADRYIDEWRNYELALPLYQKGYEFNPNNAELCARLGECYLYSEYEDKALAIDYLLKSHELAPNEDFRINYNLGLAFQLNHQWDRAIEQFNYFIKEFSTVANKDDLQSAGRHIQECKNGKILEASPIRVKIQNLGKEVNSTYAEFGPVISADESYMYFTSRRKGTTGGEKPPQDNRFYEDIYVSERLSQQWTEAYNVPYPINTEVHDAIIGLSPDGTKMLIYKDEDLFESIFDGRKWSEPSPLPSPINSRYRETAASFSFDGSILYFVSDRPGSIGGLDIYYSVLSKGGEWSDPVNLGTTVNSAYDEDGVFLHPDGTTLYFSSKGHNTMGGYDVFVTKNDKGRWLKASNIGFPINSPDDDVFFVMNADGKRAYYSSAKKGGFGEIDIYSIEFLPEPKKVEETLLTKKEEVVAVVEEKKLTLFKGRITDEKSNLPIGATVEISDVEANQSIYSINSNATTGWFAITLPSGRNYSITVKAKGYLFYSENVNLPDEKGYQEVQKTIKMEKLDVGNKIVLNNVFYESGKATLSKESEGELMNLVALLVEDDKLVIEISGHTDNTGSPAINQKLSEDRAKAVVDYLISKDIPASRLRYKGYGFSVPVAPNDTEEGRKLNRRTEFKIVSN